ncbi:hypothetical protein FKF78_11580 [Aeromonas hydrophila]|nr:hypothetical protein [Aeromonas hydrophila]
MFSTMLTACGGNGFEGTYEISMDAGNDAINKMAIQMMGAAMVNSSSGQTILNQMANAQNSMKYLFVKVVK